MIEFHNVSITFEKKREKKQFVAVKNADFTINDGEIFGILGSSGAGKSTLLRTINGLQKVTEGKVIVNNKDVNALSKKELQALRQSSGMIFQQFNLIGNKTVFDNVAFPLRSAGKSKEEIKRRVQDVLNFTGVLDKQFEYPKALSGGQKQRVAIARALANNTNILLCDEPTSALDPEMTRNVLEILKNINKELGITIVIITHEMDVAKAICNRVAVMNKGEVKEVQNIYDLFTKPKDSFTRSLIRYDTPCLVPNEIIQEEKGKIFTVRYLEDTATEPVLSVAARDYDVNFNILHAQIDYIRGKASGVLVVSAIGTDENVKKAIRYIKERTANVEFLEDEE